ncbi:two-component system, sensor histidine kinase YesM [Eubacterium uniforme]|uniref:Two-component system, sensor histidine kinase YesM n=1 Tax=Eubacterium uniforme TaxID=39495 RepID=A0A1T4VDP1_9FIRM|nr:sensor histidine kinase [Eubacterium uniforme]SKA63072.1 two-component system, sensor histidine kinase YesM [Eubacterium uniforme]
MKNKKGTPLNKRLLAIALSAFVPMCIALVFALGSLSYSSRQYSKTTRSVTYANSLLDFEERMNYSMYLAVVGKSDFVTLGNGEITVNGIKTVNPYDYIKKMQKTLSELSDIATVDINKNQIKRLNNTLNSLRQNIKTLESNLNGGGTYEENMKYLDDNVNMLTAVFEEGVKEYIQNETEYLSEIRVEQHNRNRVVYISVLVIFLMAVMISLINIYRALRAVTEPIRRLCDMSKELSKGNFNVKTKVSSTDEIAILSESFNEMAAEIGELVEDITEKQKDLSMLETKLLQAQINPHFLYNTLDTIVWLAEDNRNEEVVSMVTSLSEFFRSTLSKGRDFITVEEEKNHIESYLKIQQFRYQDIMDYEINFDEEVLNYNIPKLLLQPLVENALYHGVKCKRGKSIISVSGNIEDEYLIFVVEDDGIGMKEETLKKVRDNINGDINKHDKGSFGLANVNFRIRRYYGDDCGLYIDSEYNKGTRSMIRIKKERV